MSLQLLPDDFDQLAERAVTSFWHTRSAAATSAQSGTRGNVVSGRNMDGFVVLVERVAAWCGLPPSCVHVAKGRVVLPGYFRATKNWDVVVIHKDRLVAVFEFKSQVGSFGNNFNNRSEEVIGAAADLWVAHHRGAYSAAPLGPSDLLAHEPEPALNPVLQRDPRPPFLGWLMLLEDCPRALEPVTVSEPHFAVFPEFRGASYAKRYQILCERLVERQLYGAAALLLSSAERGGATGAYRSLSDATSLRSLFLEFAGRIAAANN